MTTCTPFSLIRLEIEYLFANFMKFSLAKTAQKPCSMNQLTMQSVPLAALDFHQLRLDLRLPV